MKRLLTLLLWPVGILCAQPALPVPLIGTWEGTTTSTSTFYNRDTGAYAAPSGESQKYTFFPNGQYKREALIQNSLYNCTDTVFISEIGSVRVQGRTIIFDSTGAELESRDNCNAAFNYKKKVPGRERSLGWRVEQDHWGVRLCFSAAGKTDSCYYRK